MSDAGARGSRSPIVVEAWPSEGPLLALSAVAAILMWLALVVSVVGIFYIVFGVLFFLWFNLAFIGQVRGSAVRLGPNQFPELHAAVEDIARRMDLTPTPEIYVMQAGGSLNAFATRFLRSNIVVLFSDLLVACGDNRAARDMIIAHELGHLKAGHLALRWFLLPSAFIPFLGTALSRAREYTADRYGLAGAGDTDGAALGLAILAAGAQHGPLVNRQELVRQRHTMARSALMTLGEWLGTHPPLSKRIAQVDPSLTAGESTTAGGPARATALLVAIPVALSFAIWLVLGSSVVKQFRATMDSARAAQLGAEPETPPPAVPANASTIVRDDLARIAAFIEDERRRGGAIPWNRIALESAFSARYPQAAFPVDPFDGTPYGYDQRADAYVLWSSGPDTESWTADDIRYDSRTKRIVVGRAVP